MFGGDGDTGSSSSTGGNSSNTNSSISGSSGTKRSDVGSTGGGGPCAEQSNNGHGSTFANKYFEFNTCVYAEGDTVKAYEFASCTTSKGPSVLENAVWKTAGNRFLVSKGTKVVVPCGGKDVPLAQWQSTYAQDIGAVVEELPPISVLMADAKAVLKVDDALDDKMIVKDDSRGTGSGTFNGATGKRGVNITVYHSAPLCAGSSVADRDTGDSVGDLYFLIRTAAAPLECIPHPPHR